MTFDNEMTIQKKKQKLRQNEYYGTQEMFDELYVRGEKGHKFKDLKSLIISEKNILLAYRKIKSNPGSKTSGVNNTTIEEIADWERKELIKYVRNRLEYYIPQAVKRVYIPKPDGRKRPLGIPTIEDRIIQQCIKQVLEPICESKFHNHSYGFRPNRSTKHAIARSMYLINLSGLHYTVDVDIAGFFDNVDHGKLLKQLWTMGIQDKNLLSILSSLLKAEIRGEGVPEKGTPQGGIISPLLASVVLNELDWWISDQWETFETDYQYSRRYSKYAALKKTNLKEVYMVRYADDLKIFCRSYETANKIKIAVIEWLKDRLNLEVNSKKTKITNLKMNYSKFLGIKFKVIKKGNKYVCKSRISKRIKRKIADELKQTIKKIQKETTKEQVLKLNSKILGKHQYYSMATHVNIDFREIAFNVNKTLDNRLNISKKGYKTKAYEKFYGKYNLKPRNVAGVRIFPIAGITTNPPLNFSQEICDYTKEGREKIHNELRSVFPYILNYLVANPVEGESIEFNDNRVSRYSGQNGCCYITGKPLTIGNIECHHKKPKHMGGKDNYRNLILVTSSVHKLIHAVNEETIEKYINKVGKYVLNEVTLNKLNKFRLKAKNECIKII